MFKSLTKSKIFLFCCLALIIGVAIASFLPTQFLQNDIWWFAGMVAGVAAAILGWRVKIARIVALLALFLFLGIWRYGLSLPVNSPDKIWHYNDEAVEVVGIVLNEPDVREDKVKYTIEVKELSSQRGDLVPVSGKILVSADLYPVYNYGDELEIRCKLKRPEKFNSFDYDRYLARYDVYSVCYRPEIRLLRTGQGNWFYGNIFKLKDKLRVAINYGLTEPEASLAGPLIFGGQKGLPSDLREKFSQTGLTHIMAVSGMNVSMLAAIVSIFLLAVGFSRRQSFYLSAVFLIIYVILVGAPASAVRAGLMGFLVLWALHLGRLYKPANSLAMAAAIMLFANPKILRDDVGWQLSFLAVLGIVYFYPFLNERMDKILLKLPKFLTSAKIFSVAKDILAVTLAAQIFTAPILAFNFSQLSLIAPLANLAVLWILPILSVMILAAIPLSLLLPAGAFLFFFPSWLFLEYIITAVRWLAKAPYASVKIDYLWWGWILLYYISIGASLFWLNAKKKNKYAQIMKKPILMTFICGILFFGIYGNQACFAETDGYYDLSVEDITASPTSPAVSQDVIVTVKIKNAGTRKLYTSIGTNTYNYQFDNFSLTKMSFTPPSYNNIISPGDYFYYIFEGKFLTVGAKKLAFKIDAANEMSENSELNNSISREITVIAAGGDDLAPGSISLSADKPIINSDVMVIVTVKNAGAASLTSSLGLAEEDILINFSGFTVTSKTRGNYPATTNPLNPGDSFKYVYNGQFSKTGENSLFFQFDRYNRLAEINENNNSLTVAKTIYLTLEEADAFNVTGITVSPVSSSSVAISWATDQATTGKVTYKKEIYESLESEALSSTATTVHKVILDNLKPDSVYYYRVVAVNGSVTKDSGYKDFKTPINNNLVITAGPQAEVGSDQKSTRLFWTTNLFSSGHVYYKKEGVSYFSQGSDDKTLEHGIKLENLPAGQYNYYVISTSTPGTTIKSPESSFKIGLAASAENTTASPTVSAPSVQTVALPAVAPTTSASDNNVLAIINQTLYNNIKGKIIIKVENKGEAYYVHPQKKIMYFLGRPADAFNVMRERGVGIINADLAKIPVGLDNLSGVDTDRDGLPDTFEDAVGTDKTNIDTDGDGFPDKTELLKGYAPLSKNTPMPIDVKFAASQKGKIFLQIESRGEAWYVNPADGKRYFLGRPADAFNVMRNLGLGISNSDFVKL